MTRDSGSEEWRPVPGYEGLYEVSSFGRLRSLYFVPPRINKFSSDETGYPVAMLSKDGKRRPFTLHRLVCRAFHGEQPNPLHKEVAHLDGDLANARSDNLKWVSKGENESHKALHGTRSSERFSNKLTVEDVREIKRLLGTRRQQQIADKFGVSYHTIQDIARGRSWRDVSTEAPQSGLSASEGIAHPSLEPSLESGS